MVCDWHKWCAASQSLTADSVLVFVLLMMSSLSCSAGSSWPYSYRLVQFFSEHREDGPRFKVQLREWEPEWLEAGEMACVSVSVPV